MKSMPKIAVIGDKDSITGFKALGISTYPVTEREDVFQALERVKEKNYAVVCITEYAAREVMPQIEEANRRFLPAIVLIPNNQGTLGLGMAQIKKNIEKAIGTDILFGKEGR